MQVKSGGGGGGIFEFHNYLGFSDGSVGKESACNAGDTGDMGRSLSQKIPWRRKWQPTPVFLPGKSHGQRSLLGYYSPWGHKELDMTERLSVDYVHSCICYLSFSLSLQTLALRRRIRKASPLAYHWNERANASALVKRDKKGFSKPCLHMDKDQSAGRILSLKSVCTPMDYSHMPV